MPGPIHFKDLLAPKGWALCEANTIREVELTLEPERVTCERCLARLGLREGNFAAPRHKDPKSER